MGRPGVRDVRQLVCWQLCERLKLEVYAFTAAEPAVKDFKFCDQIKEATASATHNIAEGFGYFAPAQFARYLGYAVGSLNEVRDELLDARDRGYMTAALYSRLTNLTRAALKTTKNLMIAKQRQAQLQRRKGDKP
jgi:four helix bundle protein